MRQACRCKGDNFKHEGSTPSISTIFMFSDKTKYPNLSILEENYSVILQEFEKVAQYKMRDWPEQEKYAGSWKVFGFYHCGRKLKSCCDYCPETTRIIESIGKVYMAGFSRMAGGTHILAHQDDVPKNITRVHMGIKVPKGPWGTCMFQVQDKLISWENGKAFAFDPTLVHAAYNKSTEERIILLLDFENFS